MLQSAKGDHMLGGGGAYAALTNTGCILSNNLSNKNTIALMLWLLTMLSSAEPRSAKRDYMLKGGVAYAAFTHMWFINQSSNPKNTIARTLW